jgi:hypothetical protein
MMRHSLNFSTIGVLTLSMLSCSNNERSVSIIPLSFLNYQDTIIDRGHFLPIKMEFYLVKNFYDNPEIEKYIDSFARSTDINQIKIYSDYIMKFYKESSQTNVENIKRNRKIIDRYSQSHDQIYNYRWRFGNGPSITKIRNGKSVGDKRKIEIKDVEK